jgi:hypothetical protein
MDAAEKLVPSVSEPLTWGEMRTRYPDEWVCVVEIDRIHPHGAEFRTARIVSHGKTRREAFEEARPWWDHYKEIGHYFTGRFSSRPLLRPALILDDETRDAIRYRR